MSPCDSLGRQPGSFWPSRNCLFDPIKEIPWSAVTHKKAFLVAITSVRLISELEALIYRNLFWCYTETRVSWDLGSPFFLGRFLIFILTRTLVLPSLSCASYIPRRLLGFRVSCLSLIGVSFQCTDSHFHHSRQPASHSNISRWLLQLIFQVYRLKDKN